MARLINNSTHDTSLEKIYDAHAANMYGCILKIVQDERKAEKILRSIFQEFYLDNLSEVQIKTEPIWFIKYASKKTFDSLKNYGANNMLPSSILERIASLKKDIAPIALSHA